MLKNLKSTKNFIKSEAGVSLVEVLVAFGILAIIATGVASLMTGGMKQQKGMQAKDQQREITAEIRSLLGKKAACFNSFGGGNPAGPIGFSRPAIRDNSAAPGAAVYTRNLNDKTNMLKFDDFKVHSLVVDPSDPSQGSATLDVKLSKVGDVGTVKEIKSDLITLKVRLAGGIITECFSLGAKVDSIWQTRDFSTDVYYNGGSVGIGTNSPQSPLYVVGAANLTNFSGIYSQSANATGAPGFCAASSAEIIYGCIGGVSTVGSFGPVDSLVGDYIVSSNTNLRFATGQSTSWTVAGGGVSTNKMSIMANGNVGIGTMVPVTKLDVAGNLAMNGKDAISDNLGWLRLNQSGAFVNGTHTPRNFNASGITTGNLYSDPGFGNIEATGTIKPGAASTGGLCSPQGAFAYDFGTNAPVFCNGTNWTSMGGALTSYSGANPGCPGGTSPFLKHWPAQWVPVNGVGAGCTTPEGWTGPPPVCEGCNNFEQCHFGYATSWDSVICR